VSKIPANKAEIIDLISEQAEISKNAATKAYNTFLESITHALTQGKTISLLGFGTFTVKSRAARTGRNPKTGAPIQIEAATVPLFKAGKALKDAVNSGTVVQEDQN
jgi:DNA-binding protein HU-beta